MSELGQFLRSRRGRVAPGDVGLPAGNGRRQTPGLRREELAAVAGVSVDYYIRLEQGRDGNPSAAVLDALAGALRLDDDERDHLRRLAEPRRGPNRRGPGRPAPVVARPGLRQLLETVRPAPAFVLTPGSDILAENPEGLALLDGLAEWPRGRRNIVRYIFRHPAARTVVSPWRRMAEDCVAHLRTAPPEQTAAIVEELVAVSGEFADLWAHYDVRVKSGTQRSFQHPAVGRLDLNSEVLTVADGQRLVVFQAVPGSPSADALALLSLAVRS
ncbi:transcriptional regulator with XRE-family HTH domain [Actinoplanes tereljensis]|uniref:Transcriptional regulator n=1 Tax=Paractinoplanes tereljensis TaxID=571912 RepID=A0A919NVE5_9ACTN|nr:helix-turn-helix transcriptional regulator [Actinoplanes tereljensis]GIF25974.1 transcriptional regulator [Actinoplanes tereljensis]